MKRAGIHRRYLEDPELTLPVNAVLELLEITALTSGIEDFGLRTAEARGLPDFGPVILMLREEATLRDAVRTLVALMHLHSEALCLRLEEDEEPILTADILVEGSVYYRQGIDAHIVGLVYILRWLLGEDWAPASVCFRHSRPGSRARYDRFFRCPIDFRHEYNGIVLRRADLNRKLPTSSPVLRRQVERYIRSIDVASSDTYVHQVTQVVAMALPRGEAKATTVARYLGTYPRALNRRLARVGLNYSQVIMNVRKSLSVQYLLDSERPLAEIAELIGFASLSAFTQWFQHAYQCAPSVWRRAQRDKRGRSVARVSA